MARKIDKNHWECLKFRKLKDYNYTAIWHNLVTIRLDEGDVIELPPEYSEFYDVSIGNKCNACCPWCYVSATDKGEMYNNICETWRKWMDTFNERIDEKGNTFTLKPFQIAIGSEGEPTMSEEFVPFLQTVYETNVVPNYTTNGIILSFWNKPESEYYIKANQILDATSKYVGGVAVSFGNKTIRKYAEEAINGLYNKGNCHIMIHHIISDKDSVDEFIEIQKKYGDKIKTHVLLPLMPSGRSTKGIEDGVFEYLEDEIEKNNITNIAFGAHFIKSLEKNSKIKTWLYPAESYSKNVILTPYKVQITPSSFDLKPIKIITFDK